MNIQVINKSKHPLPAYATELSAGMDIRANLSEPITLEPLQRCLVPTGLYIALPKGTERFGITSAEYAEPITEYKPDVTFYKAKKIKYVDSTPDTFFMFFPKNFHQALVKAGKEPEEIRVIVAKIEYIP